MDILTGNAETADTQDTGWFIGFSPWARRPDSDLLFVPQDQPLRGLCVKWFSHPAGDDSGNSKPVSEGRTVSIAVNPGARFRIEFSSDPAFAGPDLKTVLLERPGDFVAWGAGVYHRWHCIEPSTVLSIRWTQVG